MYALTGKGQQKALYTFPEKLRLLVFVDTHADSGVPVDVPPALGNAIADKLFQLQKKKSEFVAPCLRGRASQDGPQIQRYVDQ